MHIPDELEPFDSPKMLISGAKAGIAEFDRAAAAALESHTYDVVEKIDNHAREKVRVLRFHKRFPPALRTAASRIIMDLRHALDQALCDSATILKRGKTNRIQFPFSKDGAEIDGQIKRMMPDAHPDIIALVKSFQPYMGGNSFLYAVSHLASPTKHQRIVNIVPISNGFYLDATKALFIEGYVDTIGVGRACSFRNELEIARYGLDTKFTAQIDVPFQICIGEADVVGGEPAVAIFDRYAGEVESIVLAIEAETSRIMRGAG